MIKRIEDLVLAWIQRRCPHPDEMVSVDLLEGAKKNLRVSYCNRCGAVKTDWTPGAHDPALLVLPHWWRRPDPFLHNYNGARPAWLKGRRRRVRHHQV